MNFWKDSIMTDKKDITSAIYTAYMNIVELDSAELEILEQKRLLLLLMNTYPEEVFKYTIDHEIDFAEFCHSQLPKDIQKLYPLKEKTIRTPEQQQELLDALRKGKNK